MRNKRKKCQEFLEILQQTDFPCLDAVELANVARDIAVMTNQLKGLPKNADLLAILEEYDKVINQELETREQTSDTLLDVIDTNVELAMKVVINLPLEKQIQLYERLMDSAATDPGYLPLRDTVGSVISDRLNRNGNGIYS